MKADQMFNESIENKEQFWTEQAKEIDWFEFPKTILSEDENGYPQWFVN